MSNIFGNLMSTLVLKYYDQDFLLVTCFLLTILATVMFT